MMVQRYAIAASLGLLSCLPVRGEIRVLKGFTLIDGTRQAPAGTAAIIIGNGRITWIGTAGLLKAPAGAETIDLAGKFVMPGIINLHGHLGNTVELQQDAKFYTRDSVQKNLATYAAYGVTTVLSLGTDQDGPHRARPESARGHPEQPRNSGRVHRRQTGALSRQSRAAALR